MAEKTYSFGFSTRYRAISGTRERFSGIGQVRERHRAGTHVLLRALCLQNLVDPFCSNKDWPFGPIFRLPGWPSLLRLVRAIFSVADTENHKYRSASL